ncbi:hypothetical protein AB0E44_09300 [Micrococcus terreus]|uniref:hypothetical protein n=1 Tax=Micrococcus terreus TaxID=574650 RepID=UPI0033F8B7B4
MTTLDPRGLEAAAEVLCRQIMGPRSNMGNVGIQNATRFRDEARAILDAYLDVAQPTVTTVEELEGLEEGTVIELLDGTTRIRTGWSSGWASAAAGDDHPDDAHIPARVIWRPHESP